MERDNEPFGEIRHRTQRLRVVKLTMCKSFRGLGVIDVQLVRCAVVPMLRPAVRVWRAFITGLWNLINSMCDLEYQHGWIQGPLDIR